MRRSTLLVGVGLTAAALITTPVALAGPPATTSALQRDVEGIDGVRGLDINAGKTVISKANGAVIRVFRDSGRRVRIAKVPPNFLAPSVAVANDGAVWILTATGEDAINRGYSTLFLKKPGERRRQVVNIARWAHRHAAGVDPYDLEGNPRESNPYNVAALPGGGALVADAANNAVFRVTRSGTVSVVARVKPRVIDVPEEMQGPPPEGLPAQMPTEAVTTSVARGADGTVYIGELRGFPGVPETSQVWQVKPGVTNAVCDPEAPDTGDCTLKADGFTSVVALEAGRGGSLYVAELSKMGWLAIEDPNAGPEAAIGSVWRLGHDDAVRTELGAGEVILPGAVAESPRGAVFVSGPIFGPGGFKKISASAMPPTRN
jgi:hypothetical protein